MSFTAITFALDTNLTPLKLRHIETQYEKAMATIGDNVRSDTSNPIRAQVVSAFPGSPVAGQVVVFSTSPYEIYGYTGTAWVMIGG